MSIFERESTWSLYTKKVSLQEKEDFTAFLRDEMLEAYISLDDLLVSTTYDQRSSQRALLLMHFDWRRVSVEQTPRQKADGSFQRIFYDHLEASVPYTLLHILDPKHFKEGEPTEGTTLHSSIADVQSNMYMCLSYLRTLEGILDESILQQERQIVMRKAEELEIELWPELMSQSDVELFFQVLQKSDSPMLLQYFTYLKEYANSHPEKEFSMMSHRS